MMHLLRKLPHKLRLKILPKHLQRRLQQKKPQLKKLLLQRNNLLKLSKQLQLKSKHRQNQKLQ